MIFIKQLVTRPQRSGPGGRNDKFKKLRSKNERSFDTKVYSGGEPSVYCEQLYIITQVIGLEAESWEKICQK